MYEVQPTYGMNKLQIEEESGNPIRAAAHCRALRAGPVLS